MTELDFADGILPEFRKYPKIARLDKEIVITEKIDGTNAQVVVTDTYVYAGSRNRYLSEDNDNHGFAKWVYAHQELMELGVGTHYGEWWGSGIQRGYGLTNGEKRFSLFRHPPGIGCVPECCSLVPELGRSDTFDSRYIARVLDCLASSGSRAAPGYMNPEGIVIFHSASGALFKKTFDGDRRKAQ